MRYSIDKTKYCSKSEVNKLRSALSLQARNDVLILLALESGARAQELLNIQVNHLFVESSSVLIKGLKGSKDREIPVSRALFTSLQRFIPFNISYPRLDQIWASYRPLVNHKKFHSLRHTFAIDLYRRTKDIRLVQYALGHTTLTNTSVYMEYVHSQDELNRILPDQSPVIV